MGENKKNHISTLLMVVGVIFIVVAGSIFVTTAWKYLPEFAKQLTLLVAAGGLFAGSRAVAKGGKLGKTENALYYLGTAFLGFFVISLLGGMGSMADMGIVSQKTLEGMGIFPGITITSQQMNAAKLLLAALIMLVPVAARVVSKKSGFDFCMAMLLADSMLIDLSIMLQFDIEIFTLVLTGMVLVFSVLDYQRKKSSTDNSGMNLAVGIGYLVHSVICVPLIGCLELTDDVTKGITVLLVLMILVATGLTYSGREHTVFRVLNSITIFWCVFTIVKDVNAILVWTEEALPVFFAAFLVNLVIMVCMNRREMYYMQLGFDLFVPLLQACDMADCWSKDIKWYAYLPFSMMLAVACLVLWKREKDSHFLRVAGLQMVTGVVMQILAVYSISTDGMDFSVFLVTFFFLIAIAFLTIAEHVASITGKRILATIALVNGVLAVMMMSFDLIDIPWGYCTEWNCAAFGLGIVLLGFIWYDEKRNVRIVQFVLTCVVLAVLLLHCLCGGELGNVLILGIVSLVILLVSAVCNHREYAIASSITLVLMVLYITREFWLSIAWWVYLFATGVVLVVLAVKKEKE